MNDPNITYLLIACLIFWPVEAVFYYNRDKIKLNKDKMRCLMFCVWLFEVILATILATYLMVIYDKQEITSRGVLPFYHILFCILLSGINILMYCIYLLVNSKFETRLKNIVFIIFSPLLLILAPPLSIIIAFPSILLGFLFAFLFKSSGL